MQKVTGQVEEARARAAAVRASLAPETLAAAEALAAEAPKRLARLFAGGLVTKKDCAVWLMPEAEWMALGSPMTGAAWKEALK